MAATGLSYDEFKLEMRNSLRQRGVVDTLKSQVRRVVRPSIAVFLPLILQPLCRSR